MSVIKPDSTPSTGVRLDKWLWAARFFKTRSLAAEEIHKGRVSINGSTAKAAREVRVGTVLRRAGRPADAPPSDPVLRFDGIIVDPRTREVRVGDTIALRQGNIPKTVIVRALSAMRGPASVAQLLYYETEESQQQRLQLTVQRRLAPEPAAAISQQRQGRPTKRQRRDLDTARNSGAWGERWSAHWQE